MAEWLAAFAVSGRVAGGAGEGAVLIAVLFFARCAFYQIAPTAPPLVSCLSVIIPYLWCCSLYPAGVAPGGRPVDSTKTLGGRRRRRGQRQQQAAAATAVSVGDGSNGGDPRNGGGRFPPPPRKRGNGSGYDTTDRKAIGVERRW